MQTTGNMCFDLQEPLRQWCKEQEYGTDVRLAEFLRGLQMSLECMGEGKQQHPRFANGERFPEIATCTQWVSMFLWLHLPSLSASDVEKRKGWWGYCLVVVNLERIRSVCPLRLTYLGGVSSKYSVVSSSQGWGEWKRVARAGIVVIISFASHTVTNTPQDLCELPSVFEKIVSSVSPSPAPLIIHACSHSDTKTHRKKMLQMLPGCLQLYTGKGDWRYSRD